MNPIEIQNMPWCNSTVACMRANLENYTISQRPGLITLQNRAISVAVI